MSNQFIVRFNYKPCDRPHNFMAITCSYDKETLREVINELKKESENAPPFGIQRYKVKGIEIIPGFTDFKIYTPNEFVRTHQGLFRNCFDVEMEIHELKNAYKDITYIVNKVRRVC